MSRRPNWRWTGYVLAMGALFPLSGFGQTTPSKAKTVWDGIYTQAQADRGYVAYGMFCSRCHGEDLSGVGGVLHGEKFMDRWREDNLNNLFTLITQTMPPGPRDRVGTTEYLDILAYVLNVNQFPAGSSELAANGMDRIMVFGKDGPQAVPDFALVTVSGCLQTREKDHWMLTNASEPVRTRNPRESPQPELAAAEARAPGAHTFGLLDTINFPKELHAGRWMEAKGFLIRSPGDDRINLTWLHELRETCESRGAR